ncbi:MAG: cytidine deaminase [Chitinophagaceae bacterium]|nr:MAG: cytidine deaminase [Chitinophagaceae bacterium]
MKKEMMSFGYELYDSADELSPGDAELLSAARKITSSAYAPYSHFKVGATARLANGEIVNGTNQENAAYPVGICAERVLMGTAAVLHPNMPIETMAISYQSEEGDNSKPASPCGMCRQYLKEFEDRTQAPVRLILSGQTGKVYIIESASQLLPFSFGGADLK